MGLRLGKKAKSALRLGAKVAVVAGVALGIKHKYGEDAKGAIADKAKEKGKELVSEGVAAAKDKVVKIADEQAVQANVKYLADEAKRGAIAGGKAGLKAAVLPKFAGGGNPVVAARQAAAKHEQAITGHVATVKLLGGAAGEAAIKQRDELRSNPNIVHGGGAGSFGKFACQTGCASKHPKLKGRKYNKCMTRCD